MTMLRAVTAFVLSLAMGACTAVRNPATGETQYTSMTPADEAKLGRRKASRRWPSMAVPTPITDCSPTFPGSASDGQSVGYARPEVHLYRARQRHRQRLLAAGRLRVHEPRPAGAGQQRGRGGRRAGARNRARDGSARGPAVRPRRMEPAAARAPASRAAFCSAMPALNWRPGAGVRLAGAAAYVQGYSRDRSSRPTSSAFAIWLAQATTQAMVTLLSALQANDELQQKLTEERPKAACRAGSPIIRAPPTASSAPPVRRRWRRRRQTLDRDRFLTAVDGLVSATARTGVRPRPDFEHPGLRLRFTAPEGFKLINAPTQVQGSDGHGRVMQFDVAKLARVATSPSTCKANGSATSTCPT